MPTFGLLFILGGAFLLRQVAVGRVSELPADARDILLAVMSADMAGVQTVLSQRGTNVEPVAGGGSAADPGSTPDDIGTFDGAHLWPSGTRKQHTSGYPGAIWAGDINDGDDMGKPVRAFRDGVVIDVQNLTTSYGKHVRISHGDQNTLYAHLSAISVKPGQRVKMGQTIGKVGETGNAHGPHLHFEIRKGER